MKRQHLLIEKILVEKRSTKIPVDQSNSQHNLCLAVGQGVTPLFTQIVLVPPELRWYQLQVLPPHTKCNTPATGYSNIDPDHYNLA